MDTTNKNITKHESANPEKKALWDDRNALSKKLVETKVANIGVFPKCFTEFAEFLSLH